jgi:FkbM family methyltransferase
MDEGTHPRLLIVDMTVAGNGTATGELKETLLEDWPKERMMFVFGDGPGRLAARVGSEPSAPVRKIDSINNLLARFAPDCILYRPLPDHQRLHQFAMSLIQSKPVPLVTWVMDDWPERLAREDSEKSVEMKADLEWLFARSHSRLCISKNMQRAYEGRYQQTFVPIANGVRPQDWASVPREIGDSFVVRYAGSLADNMTLHSVLRVAAAIEQLSSSGRAIRFQINTRSVWSQRHGHLFGEFRSCEISTENFSTVDYRKFLQTADLLVIAYNFDQRSVGYVRHSLANKLPECLASGAALLAHGPAEVATIEYLAENMPEVVVCVPQIDALVEWVGEIFESEKARQMHIDKARGLAFAKFNLADQKGRLTRCLIEASEQPYDKEVRRASRAQHVQVEESAVAMRLLQDVPADGAVMFDVGAHYGSSLLPFAELGWQVIAFEPDVRNREVLQAKVGGFDNVRIDPLAIGAVAEHGRVFYTSDVSSGIKSLLPFHESHTESHEVDVTTIEKAMAFHKVAHIDFLKIDVEGFDLNVLQGVPWDRVHPRVVLCEFEDQKTLRLGHNWNAVAEYLTARNYQVWVSEWHPIEEYGKTHDWCSMRQYPCELNSQDAWGNLIALDKPIDHGQMADALDSVLAERARKLENRPSPLRRRLSSLYRNLRSRLGLTA